MSGSDLRALQRRLGDAIRSRSAKAASGAGVSGRIGIYRYAYRARIEESLEEDFPRLRTRLGRRGFSELVTGFLEKEPSRYASLAEVSSRLPEYLARSKNLRSKPWLLDLARLEWQLIRARVSAEAEVFDFSSLGAWTEAEHEGMRVRFHPEFKLFRSRWNFLSRKPARSDFKIVVFKSGRESGYRKVTDQQWKVLEALGQGRPLAEVAGALAQKAGKKGGNRVSEQEVSRWFSDWVARGWICRVEPGPARSRRRK